MNVSKHVRKNESKIRRLRERVGEKERYEVCE